MISLRLCSRSEPEFANTPLSARSRAEIFVHDRLWRLTCDQEWDSLSGEERTDRDQAPVPAVTLIEYSCWGARRSAKTALER
jgi:hypothetical protein